jgi:hypothetical protein
VRESFPYVRSFVSIQGWGRHLLASCEPIEARNAADLAARLPLNAKKDLMEWSNKPNLQAYLQAMLAMEIPFEEMLNPDKTIGITDDEPYNEYFFLRGAK